MIRSLNTAERAMQLQQTRIDALANNLANANSTGFRQILTRVAERGADSTGEIGPGLPLPDGDRLPRTTDGTKAWAPGHSAMAGSSRLSLAVPFTRRRAGLSSRGTSIDL